MPPESKSTGPAMSRSRIVMAHAIIAFLCFGSLWAIVKDRDYWPFSHYGMFSRINQTKTRFTNLRLYGVVAGQDEREVPLYRQAHLQPFDSSRFMSAVRKIRRRKNSDKTLRRFLRSFLSRYEELREAGRHDGPPLSGVRLYLAQWELDPWARNHDEPALRKLLMDSGSGK